MLFMVADSFGGGLEPVSVHDQGNRNESEAFIKMARLGITERASTAFADYLGIFEGTTIFGGLVGGAKGPPCWGCPMRPLRLVSTSTVSQVVKTQVQSLGIIMRMKCHGLAKLSLLGFPSGLPLVLLKAANLVRDRWVKRPGADGGCLVSVLA